MRARTYDPQTGQFLTRDPIEEVTRSAYGYVAGDPTNSTDPSGMCIGIGCQWGQTAWGKAIVNVASGILEVNPITATTNVLGLSDTSQYADTTSAAFTAGEIAGSLTPGPKGMGGGAAFKGCTARQLGSVDEAVGGLQAGKRANVYTVESKEELMNVHRQLTDGDVVPGEWSRYSGSVLRRPDGVEIGLRIDSKSGGPTLDMRHPTGDPLKVHIR